MLVIMMLRGFRLKQVANPGVTLITMDPGTVNTKMLIAGWGACDMDVE